VSLTVEQFRDFVRTSLSDESVQKLLEAAKLAIDQVAGPVGEITETIEAWEWGDGLPRITTKRPMSAVVSVTEYVGDRPIVLAADDYRVSGYVLTRLGHGTNPRWHWGSRVVVVYATADDAAERDRVQLELVKLDLTYSPGLSSQTIGTWSEAYTDGATYAADREAILSSLLPTSGGGMVVVGG
jgi:hypothetical protein